MFTSQKNSFPRSPQNHEIHDTSSELLMFGDGLLEAKTNLTSYNYNKHLSNKLALWMRIDVFVMLFQRRQKATKGWQEHLVWVQNVNVSTRVYSAISHK